MLWRMEIILQRRISSTGEKKETVQSTPCLGSLVSRGEDEHISMFCKYGLIVIFWQKKENTGALVNLLVIYSFIIVELAWTHKVI